jgi:hypothetical protein
MPSHLFMLVDRILGCDLTHSSGTCVLQEYLERQVNNGASGYWITHDLVDRTGIYVSHQTVRRWIKQTEEE